jgi:short subunit dehydrogenase-like uncharacterized protein
MSTAWMIYGANGYTGELVAREAAHRGLQPVLAGRDRAAVERLAGELGLPHVVVALDDPTALRKAVGSVRAVLHCAGPFSRTSRAMVDACLAERVHYLDITGEIVVFEACAARDGEAKAAGVVMLPGAGFDVVPSDCLAAHLKRRLPTAARLTLAFQSRGGVSRGTATTMVDNLGNGGAVRRGGRITRVRTGWRTRQVDFGRGPRPAVTIPWGDVSTAYHSTGIPDIEVYVAVPDSTRLLMRAAGFVEPLLRTAMVRDRLRRRVRSGAPGPTAEQRAKGGTVTWGEVEDDRGGRASARQTGPDGYTLTVEASIVATQRLVEGGVAPGFQTPAKAFGPDFVLGLPGVAREDL